MRNQHFEQIRRLLGQVGEFVRSSAPTAVIEIKTHDGYTLAIYWRCRSLYEAARLLIEKGFPEEALIIGRSLFTESLWLMELERVGDQRAAYLMGWANSAIDEKKNLLSEAVRRDLDTDVTDELAWLEEQRRKLQGYMKRHGIRRVEKFGDDKQLAELHGRQQEYWDYRYAHNLVHGSQIAHGFRLRKAESGEYQLFAQTLHPRILAAAAAFVMGPMLLAHRSTFRILGWPESAELDRLLGQVDAMGEYEIKAAGDETR